MSTRSPRHASRSTALDLPARPARSAGAGACRARPRDGAARPQRRLRADGGAYPLISSGTAANLTHGAYSEETFPRRTAYPLLVALLLTLGCEGPVGPQGSSGPQGSTGAQGTQGPAGNDGQDGATGPQGPEGPGGPEGPQGPEGPGGQDGSDGQDGQDGADGEPLDWADVLTEHRIEEAVYSVGFTYTHPEDGQRYYRGSFCSGFAAYYTSVIWTNAHCVEALEEILAAWADLDPAGFVVRSGTWDGYEVTEDTWIHP